MTDKELLARFNAPAGATLIQTYKNGNIKVQYQGECDRCGGKGIYIVGVCNGKPVPSWVDHGVCFKCGGSGRQTETAILMTPENEAKAAEKRRKQEEAYAAEQAKREAEREEQERREQEEKERREAEIKAAKAKSQYVGNVGDRIEVKLTLIYTATWEQKSYAGFGTETMRCHIMKDADGNTFTWKTGNTLYIPTGDGDFDVANKGDTVVLKGTIKEHSEYKDEKQTVLTRCKVTQIEHTAD